MTTYWKRDLSHYRIEDLIKQGSYSLVYRATDTRTGKAVALKHVLAKRGADVVEAHYRGAQVQELLSPKDDRVVRIYEFERWQDDLLIAMEFVDGKELSSPQPLERALEIAKDIYGVLDKAHNIRGVKGDAHFDAIVHGDLKPENILVNKTGKIKILDFGSAKELQKSGKATKGEFGTVAYCSPERVRDANLSHHVDLWAAGIILYEMLVGQLPYSPQDVDNTERLERAIRRCRRIQFPDDSSCPPTLKRIVAKILDPDIGRRYQSAKQISEDLEAFQQGRPTIVEEEPESAPNHSSSTIYGTTSEPRNTTDTRPTQHTDLPGHRSSKGQGSPQDGDNSAPEGAETNPTTRTDKDTAGESSSDGSKDAQKNSKRTRRLYGLVAAIVFLAVCAVPVIYGIKELTIRSEAEELAKQLESGQLTDPDKAWGMYKQLVSRSHFGVGPQPALQPLKKMLTEKAGRILANYLDDIPTVKENDYKTSKTMLEHAVELDPGDKEAKALLAYCNGHINRINAEARRKEGKSDEANDLFNEAIKEFKSAASIKTDWSEPHLGMGRVYVIGLDDLENGPKEYSEAGKYNHPPGKRDKWILAQGYCRRGYKLLGDSGKTTDRSLKKELLLRAKQDYEQCVNEYQGIEPFADATRSIETAQTSLRQIIAAVGAIESEQDTQGGEGKAKSVSPDMRRH